MHSLVVLGQVPGTNIEISFTMWLVMSLIALSLFMAVRMYRHKPMTGSMAPTIGSDDGQAATAH